MCDLEWFIIVRGHYKSLEIGLQPRKSVLVQWIASFDTALYLEASIDGGSH